MCATGFIPHEVVSLKLKLSTVPNLIIIIVQSYYKAIVEPFWYERTSTMTRCGELVPAIILHSQ